MDNFLSILLTILNLFQMLRLNSFKCNVRNSALALGLILTASLSSCEEKGLDLYGENREDVEATFITTIRPSTRMSDDKWESGDAIGVFAISNGEILSDSTIYNKYKNIKYINKSNCSIANFKAAETAIKYPNTKEMLDRSEERRVGKECRSRWEQY